MICPNESCRQVIATNYPDSTCGSCSAFVHVSRGKVIARLELGAVRPIFGGAKSRDGRLINKEQQVARSTTNRGAKATMPKSLVRDQYNQSQDTQQQFNFMSNYNSVISTSKSGKGFH